MLLSNVSLRQRIGSHPGTYTEPRVNDIGEVVYDTRSSIVVTPYTPAHIQPCSIDVYLNYEPIQVYKGACFYMDKPHINAHEWNILVPVRDPAYDEIYYKLEPGNLYLASTLEYFEIPHDLCGQLRGVSTNGRMGIVPHKEAGLLDPGWKGRVTCELEVMYTTYMPVPDATRQVRIGHVTFEQLDHPAYPTYRGRYLGDLSLSPAKPKLEV